MVDPVGGNVGVKSGRSKGWRCWPKLHGRKVKSYELDVACSKLGFQNEDYKKCMSI